MPERNFDRGLCSGLFSRDGLIHPVYPSRETVTKGRRDILNTDSYDTAAVCLTCDADECEGETKCFRRQTGNLLVLRMADMPELPVGTLLDDLIYADEVCEDGTWDDVPWE